MNPADPYQDLRSALRELCAQFPAEYFRRIDEHRAYPEEFVDALTKAGWLAALIPEEYGGSGLGLTEASVIMEEINRAGGNAGACHGQMYNMGTLLRHGSDSQKRRYLPKIARGEIRWCQGYSEPGSGSDLASLQTRAEDKGDQFLVNGSKIWTSYADKADWIFCLVRTDPNAPKHEGISFLLFDMESAGVSTKPITLISGASPFCQTFFDDVLVPKANLVGKLNKGWDIAKYLLTHERDMIGGMGSTTENRSLGQIASETIGTESIEVKRSSSRPGTQWNLAS